MWDMIAREMNEVKTTHGVCQNKWSNMEIRYKEKKIRRGKLDWRATLALF